MHVMTSEKRRIAGEQRPNQLILGADVSRRAERWFGRCAQGMALSLLTIFLLIDIRPADASFIDVPLESVAQIMVDENNEPLDYPTAVFYDPHEDEIYLVNGGNGRVIVYGPDFFPRISIGKGRGVAAPRDGLVMENGEVYLCQIKNFKNPERRITVLNPAFFVDREIFLDQIPEAGNFNARSMAVSSDGTIYLAGNNNRGVLVIDRDGNFLRRIEPMGEVSARILAMEEENEAAREEKEGKDSSAAPEGEAPSEETGEQSDAPESDGEDDPAPEDDLFADIPEEYRPQTNREKRSSRSGDILAPVKINYVTIDATGKIYMISPEVGKIYVYGPDETFLFSFGMKGGSPGQMSQPRALAVDEERKLIYVADYMRHTILVFNKEGKHLFEVGGRGFQALWFNYPTGVTVNTRGHLVVADLFNKRVQVIHVGYEEVFPLLESQSSEGSTESTEEISEFAEEISESTEEVSESAEESKEEDPPAEVVEEILVEEVIFEDADVAGHPAEPGRENPESPSGPADPQ